MIKRNPNAMREGKLLLGEDFWVAQQPWLKDRGYNLRARYQPDWVASWKKPVETTFLGREDAVVAQFSHLLDAQQDDGSFVMLKRLKPSEDHNELEIGRHFSSEAMATNPKNHCVAIFDVLQVPGESDEVLLVMPLLYENELPPFETIGEVVDFFRQIFEGLHFMHQNHIAHRDCKYDNFMADASPLYDSPPHPFSKYMKRDFSGKAKPSSTRTRRPIKYYLVDFGLSRRYNPEEAPYLEPPGWGGDKTVPEFLASSNYCDPFPVDVYSIGNAIRRHFLEGYESLPAKKGFGFMKDLVASMTQDNPQQRPTMDEVVAQFSNIAKRLSSWKLRSRVVNKDERRLRGVVRSSVHWLKQAGLIIKRIPAIPTYDDVPRNS